MKEVPEWTLAEALAELDPPVSRRDLCRMLSGLNPMGYRRGRRGRPAAVYRRTDVRRLHAEWMRQRADVGLPIAHPLQDADDMP